VRSGQNTSAKEVLDRVLVRHFDNRHEVVLAESGVEIGNPEPVREKKSLVSSYIARACSMFMAPSRVSFNKTTARAMASGYDPDGDLLSLTDAIK
jgi:hypothetical protein